MRSADEIAGSIRVAAPEDLGAAIDEATEFLREWLESGWERRSTAVTFLTALEARELREIQGCAGALLRLLSVSHLTHVVLGGTAADWVRNLEFDADVLDEFVDGFPPLYSTMGFDSGLITLAWICRVKENAGQNLQGSPLEMGLISRCRLIGGDPEEELVYSYSSLLWLALQWASPAYLPTVFDAAVEACGGISGFVSSRTANPYFVHPSAVEPERFRRFMATRSIGVMHQLLKNASITEQQARDILVHEPDAYPSRGERFGRFPWFVLEAIEEHREADLCGILKVVENEEARRGIAEILLLSAERRGLGHFIPDVAPEMYAALGEDAGARLFGLFKREQLSSSMFAVRLADAWSGRPGPMLEAILSHGTGAVRGRPLYRGFQDDEDVTLYHDRILPALLEDRNKGVRERALALANELRRREWRLARERAVA